MCVALGRTTLATHTRKKALLHIPSDHTYFVCYALAPRKEDQDHDVYGARFDRITEKPIETALLEMDGIRKLGDVWVVKARRTSSEKLKDQLKQFLKNGDSLMVASVRSHTICGKGIGDALDLLDELLMA